MWQSIIGTFCYGENDMISFLQLQKLWYDLHVSLQQFFVISTQSCSMFTLSYWWFSVGLLRWTKDHLDQITTLQSARHTLQHQDLAVPEVFDGPAKCKKYWSKLQGTHRCIVPLAWYLHGHSDRSETIIMQLTNGDLNCILGSLNNATLRTQW